MKLYSISERRAALLAVCSSTVSARRVTPPSVSAQRRESALLQVTTPVAVGVPAGVPTAALVTLVVPAAVEALWSARVEGVVATAAESTGNGTNRIDETHVASAAQLDQRGIRVQGTTGFSAKQDMTALKPNGGVRGAPPRGRPV